MTTYKAIAVAAVLVMLGVGLRAQQWTYLKCAADGPCIETPAPLIVPAREWDGPEDGEYSVRHVSCKGVSADWKLRYLLERADGKQECVRLDLLLGADAQFH